MIETEELMKLRASRPYLFDVENPVEGLAAVNRVASEYQLLLRALGTLKRSYSARIAKSPFLALKRDADKIAGQAAALHRADEAPVQNIEHHIMSPDETDAFVAEMTEFMNARQRT